MSALPRRTDLGEREHQVRNVPTGDSRTAANNIKVGTVATEGGVAACCFGESLKRLCVPKTLNPTIVVMKSAQDGAGTDGTGALYRARDRRILVKASTSSGLRQYSFSRSGTD